MVIANQLDNALTTDSLVRFIDDGDVYVSIGP
jgi:hypothetical protein